MHNNQYIINNSTFNLLLIAKLKTIKLLIFLVLTISIFLSCDNYCTTYQQKNSEFLGQLEADIGHAILKPDGTVWAWGGNSTGQLGDGTMNPSIIPVQVSNLEDVVAIDLATGAGVAVDRYGDIWFWGNSLLWAEGPYELTITEPINISNLKNAIFIEMKGNIIDLLKNDGTVWRLEWDHLSPTKYLEPLQIPDMENVKQISSNLALKTDGTLCEFPNRLFIHSEKEGLIESIQDVAQIGNRIPSNYVIILKQDGTVWAWGDNTCGYLGNGTFNDSDTPVQVKHLENITSISVNGAQCLALQNDGTVWFWGLSYLNLDQNIEIYQNVPIKIEDIDDVVLIKPGGGNKSIVMKADGTYWVFDSINRIPEEIVFN